MGYDEYWSKFVTDGKVESYLNYIEHLKAQDSLKNDAKSDNNRRADYTGATNR